jgi:ABC-2 type transport system permease protein
MTMTGTVQIGRQSLVFAVAQMRATHTWVTWTFGWLGRLLVQVVFFALIGGFVGSRTTLQYVLVGNMVMLCCLESMIVVLAMAEERSTGTLALLTIAPASHVPIYLSRGLHWLASGIVSSLTAWLVLPLLLGVGLPWPRAALAIPMIVLIAITSYCYGCFLGTVALRRLGLTWIALNFGYLPIMAFCGVNVPTSFWPRWVQAIGDVLPVTHGLHAIRATLAGAPAPFILRQLCLELLVGAGWLAIAAYSVGRVVRHGMAAGTLDFGE